MVCFSRFSTMFCWYVCYLFRFFDLVVVVVGVGVVVLLCCVFSVARCYHCGSVVWLVVFVGLRVSVVGLVCGELLVGG